MAYRKATPQETREWLGSGLVMPGRRPPTSSEQSSMPSPPSNPSMGEVANPTPLPNNQLETEQDAQIVQDRRRFRALQSLRAQLDQTPASSPSPGNTPATTASPSDAKANTPR